VREATFETYPRDSSTALFSSIFRSRRTCNMCAWIEEDVCLSGWWCGACVTDIKNINNNSVMDIRHDNDLRTRRLHLLLARAVRRLSRLVVR
jgi:hypothetical protein